MTESIKATVDQSALLKCLGRVHRVVERKNTIPILGNVLMKVEQDRIVFKGTDLDLVIGDSVPAEVAAKGTVTVPAHLLHDIVRKMAPGSQIVLETDNKTAKLVVRSGRSRFTLQTLPASDFPELTAEDTTNTFEIEGKALHHLIDKSSFAISTEETRYYLNGVYLHVAGGDNSATLRAVATDGHRLAQVEMALPEGARGMAGVIVPRKTIGAIGQLFDAGSLVQIEVSTKKIRFSAGDISLHSKLIDGTFPDYGRVIPQENNKILVMDRKALEAAADRVTTISTERGRAVKVSLSAGKIVLSVTNPDAGDANEELEAEYTADPLDIGFNSRYLADILKQVEGEKVTVKLADPGSPTIVLGGGESNSLFVIMPMRV